MLHETLVNGDIEVDETRVVYDVSLIKYVFTCVYLYIYIINPVPDCWLRVISEFQLLLIWLTMVPIETELEQLGIMCVNMLRHYFVTIEWFQLGQAVLVLYSYE